MIHSVAVRVCPILDSNDVPCIQVTPNSAILFDEGGTRNKLRRYVYDHVFDDKSTQEIVYQKTTAALVKDVLNGYSAAVFAYGATGSGEFSYIN
ncbi:CLUMA_CG008466, isoform A [Clunio marinus]|uniref:CLUMA_CG008466, isoform A n=1 Tax=Clunio marinus TaxID=568069 RepID=A0A1J1I5F7_9DIPT|nr:CLUMA_CG008466, isoform A [Clunio marinus]